QTLETRDLQWGSLADDVHRLERMEFVNKDFLGAIQGYVALQSKTGSPELQAAILKNIAGDYRQLHKNDKAIAEYLSLAHTYEHIPDISGYPMGILGRQMATQIDEDDHAWDQAFDLRLDLFEGLLYKRWKLPSRESQSLLHDLQSALERSNSASGHTL